MVRAFTVAGVLRWHRIKAPCSKKWSLASTTTPLLEAISSTPKSQLADDVRHDCPTCTADQIAEKVAAQEKNLLRDLIDNSLLVQRAKDMDINVDTQVIKRLDEIRIDNKIASMEDLEHQVTQTGVDFEDFKNNIRNQLLQQEVIRREVGSKIILDHAEILKYYEDHKQEFVRPEQVVLARNFREHRRQDSRGNSRATEKGGRLAAARQESERILASWPSVFPTAAPPSRAATWERLSVANSRPNLAGYRIQDEPQRRYRRPEHVRRDF